MNSPEAPNAAAVSADFEFAALHEALFYPRAIVEEFTPYLKGQVIEVGAGIGQLTALFAEKIGRENVQGIEPDAQFARLFRERCPDIRLVEGTVSELPSNTACDTIVSVNVMEHIRDHVEEMTRYRNLLAPRKGHLCILTPARPEIYARIDKDFGHFRRYTKSSIQEALASAGFIPKKIFYFNFPGYFVWLLNFKILKSRSFNPLMVKFYDRSVFRIAHALERNVARPPVGQSIIATPKLTDAPERHSTFYPIQSAGILRGFSGGDVGSKNFGSTGYPAKCVLSLSIHGPCGKWHSR
ncbi:MAG: methyltransferase domain-containing protein [Verrucomicrobiota bacterium]